MRMELRTAPVSAEPIKDTKYTEEAKESVKVDHAFLFIIREKVSEQILLQGKYSSDRQ